MFLNLDFDFNFSEIKNKTISSIHIFAKFLWYYIVLYIILYVTILTSRF